MSDSDSGKFWFCVKHHRVESGEDICPPIDRLGPYATSEEAERALDQGGGAQRGVGQRPRLERRTQVVTTSLTKASPWPFVGMIGMAAAFFLYAASGLVAPVWALTVLMFVWLVLFVTACRWWTPHPRRRPVAGRRRDRVLVRRDHRRRRLARLDRLTNRRWLRKARSACLETP